MTPEVRWRLAAEALATIVREDYPADLRLSAISVCGFCGKATAA